MKKKRKKAIRLLRESVEHWRRIYCGNTRPGEDSSGRHCPLCLEYIYSQDTDAGCKGCPVREFTGRADCIRTPWFEAHVASKKLPGHRTMGDYAAIMAEIEFLEYLALDLEFRRGKPGEAERFARYCDLSPIVEVYRGKA
jgi:hypothetical protein